MNLGKIKVRSVKKTAAVALLALVAAAAGLQAAHARRNGSVLGDRIERSLKSKDPLWRIRYKNKAGDKTRQMWAYGSDSVTVSVDEKATTEEAAKALAASAASVNGAQALKADGVGDEAYLITADSTPHPERGEAAGVIFRKGNVVVYVNVSSKGSGGGLNVAQSFARHVAEQIPAN